MLSSSLFAFCTAVLGLSNIALAKPIDQHHHTLNSTQPLSIRDVLDPLPLEEYVISSGTHSGLGTNMPGDPEPRPRATVYSFDVRGEAYYYIYGIDAWKYQMDNQAAVRFFFEALVQRLDQEERLRIQLFAWGYEWVAPGVPNAQRTFAIIQINRMPHESHIEKAIRNGGGPPDLKISVMKFHIPDKVALLPQPNMDHLGILAQNWPRPYFFAWQKKKLVWNRPSRAFRPGFDESFVGAVCLGVDGFGMGCNTATCQRLQGVYNICEPW